MPKLLIKLAASIAALSMSAVPNATAGTLVGFGDVPRGAFYAEAVQWLVDEGLSNGTALGCFSPSAPATRAEVSAMIHRYAGEPSGSTSPFEDVPTGAYYADAVGWMASVGITTGTSPTTFAPDRLVTRGELATLLHRFDGRPAAGSEPFTDVRPGDFFAEGVAWMSNTGITTGTSSTTFSPYRPVTRGELATFLYRYEGSPPVSVAGGICSTDELADVLFAEDRSFARLNDLRVGMGLAPLSRTATMDSFARDWSSTMHDGAIFRHSSGPYGENIAWWSFGSAEPQRAADFMHDRWVDSEGHFRNMMDGRFTQVGIGFWQGPRGWYATHVFR